MLKKRLFQIFDEMNVNDEKNKTAHLPCSFTMVEAKSDKRGGLITMGVEAHIIQKIMFGDMQPVLVVMDKKEYYRLEAIPVEPLTSEQIQTQIEQEAEANTIRFKDVNDYDAGRIGGYKEGYEAAGVHYAALWQEAEQRAETITDKIIDLMDFVAEAKGHISDEEIISQVRRSLPVLLETLTPKTGEDE